MQNALSNGGIIFSYMVKKSMRKILLRLEGMKKKTDIFENCAGLEGFLLFFVFVVVVVVVIEVVVGQLYKD